MRQIYFRACIVFLSLATTSPGNAGVNVGMSDFGRVANDSSDKNNTCREITPKYLTPDQAKPNAIVLGDIYEVILKRVHIDNSYDPGFFNRARIALVTKGFEMSDDKTNPAAGFDFSPKAADSGRVVYYSEDVRKGQFLNFGQITMFGPVEYHGNPLGISLFAIEVEGKNEKINALLSTLAGLGKQFAVPGTPIISVLETLGTNLIRGNKDDILMRYDTSVNSSEGARPELYTLFHQYGEYVMVRMEDRSKSVNWSEFRYSPDTGVLYKINTGDKVNSCVPANEYTGTYDVIQVNKSAKEAFTTTQTFGDLRKLIEASDTEDLAAFQASASKVTDAISNGKLYKKIRRAILAIENSPTPEPYKITELTARLKDVKTSIDLLNGTTAKPTPGTIYLNQFQVDVILAQLNKIANSPTIISQDTFDADAASALVIKKGKS